MTIPRWHIPSVLIKGLLQCFLILISISVLLARAQDAGALTQREASRFVRTVNALAGSPEDQRREFASIGLTQLALTHAMEAELARIELAENSENPKLRGWAMAVDRFAHDLSLLGQEIDAGGLPAFSLSHQGEVAITVAGRMIFLSHPRRNQQGLLEQAILQEFCTRNACHSLTQSTVDPTGVAVTTASVKPAWNFTEDGYICSQGGISLLFFPGDSLANQRTTCADVIREILHLSDEVAWQMQHGVDVDWDGLMISPTPARPQHRVQLNAAGDSVLLALPMLARNPDLLQAAAAWMHRRLQLQSAAAKLELRAQDYQLEVPPAQP